MLGVGESAPDFHLRDIEGHEKSLRDFTASKPTLVAFFKISCPVCQMTAPFLERLAHSNQLEVIGVSQDDAEATSEFREEYGVTFSTLLDEEERGYPASNRYGIEYVPTLFLVEPSGEISMSGTGFCKRDLESIGCRIGVPAFRPGEKVPEFRAG
ncbi:MAG: TlpA family protein disulfide reductase [Acidobacteria bacterium]|nr:TlpA family protein disulfide reductase [Acidobacteriota bacterium]